MPRISALQADKRFSAIHSNFQAVTTLENKILIDVEAIKVCQDFIVVSEIFSKIPFFLTSI